MGSLEEVAEPAVSGLASSSSLLPASGLGQRAAEIGDEEEWCSTTRVAIEVATPRGENDQPLAVFVRTNSAAKAALDLPSGRAGA